MIIMIIDVQGPLCQFRDNAILKQKVSIPNISVLFSSIYVSDATHLAEVFGSI